MSDPKTRSVRRHWILTALPFVAAAITTLSTIGIAAVAPQSSSTWPGIVVVIIFATVGSVIEDRRPGQAVGRICLGVGVLMTTFSVLVLGAVALDSLPGRLPPPGAVLALVANAMSGLVLFLSGPLLVSRFPDGREPGRLAGLTDGLLAIAGLIVLTGVFRPGPLQVGSIEPVDNPLGVSGIPFVGSDYSFVVSFLAYGLGSILALVGLIRRYVRGSPVVRAQIRWLGAAIGTSIVFLALLFLTGGNDELNNAAFVGWLLSLLLPPVAIGIAILRYRLYDIDRIISRTISYGLVTALLVMSFLLVNLGLQALLSSVTSGNSLAVAGSTLLAAALFTPVRRRVQGLVDRRFNRAHYDAERMVTDFAARMRDELDLPTLATELAAATARAVEPTTAALWLRRQAAP
jgi:hypothetical protein